MEAKINQNRRQLLAMALTLGVIAVLLVDAWIFLFPAPRYLLIHADDAGLCPAVNEATIEAMERGVVSSASIIVVCPGFEEIADYAIAHPEKDFGVHLVLTCENHDFRWGPILKDRVPSLVQPDGSFWASAYEVTANAKAEEVDRELRAQIQRALDRGIPITHLDHHMWVLTKRLDLFQIYLELGREFELPIRVHKHFSDEEFGSDMGNPADYKAMIQPLANNGNPLLDFIDANNYRISPGQKWDYFLQLLQQVEPGVSEFIVHCSVNRPGMLLPNGAESRATDLRILTSKEMAEEIRRQGIKVVSWKELVRLKRAGKI
jgi:predicted glycoside hydrolase/deacetylase ChbG (UPF0249 family)